MSAAVHSPLPLLESSVADGNLAPRPRPEDGAHIYHPYSPVPAARPSHFLPFMNSSSRKRPISRISTTTGPIVLPLKLTPTQPAQRRPPPPPPSHKHRRTRLTRIPPPPKPPIYESEFEDTDDPFSDDKCTTLDPTPSIRNPFLSPILMSTRIQELQNAPCPESRFKLVAGKILNRVGRRSMRHSIARRMFLNQNGHFYVKSGLSNVLVIHETDTEDSD